LQDFSPLLSSPLHLFQAFPLPRTRCKPAPFPLAILERTFPLKILEELDALPLGTTPFRSPSIYGPFVLFLPLQEPAQNFFPSWFFFTARLTIFWRSSIVKRLMLLLEQAELEAFFGSDKPSPFLFGSSLRPPLLFLFSPLFLVLSFRRPPPSFPFLSSEKNSPPTTGQGLSFPPETLPVFSGSRDSRPFHLAGFPSDDSQRTRLSLSAGRNVPTGEVFASCPGP